MKPRRVSERLRGKQSQSGKLNIVESLLLKWAVKKCIGIAGKGIKSMNQSVTVSKRFSMNGTDIKKVVIGLGIALLGAGATYMQENIGQIDFGTWQPMAFAINSMLVNAIRKFIQNYGSVLG